MNALDLSKSVAAAEIAERIKRGLPPDHILDFAEFPFAFAMGAVDTFDHATAKWLQKKPESENAASYRVWAVLARKDYGQANSLMDLHQRLAPDEPKAGMRFGHTPEISTLVLPPVLGDYPREPAFFVSCDRIYFELFGLPLLRSIAANAPGTPVHVHLMSGDVDVLARARSLSLRISSTSEEPQDFIGSLNIAPNHYYNAARFIRFAEALEVCDGPLWILDTDSLATADPRPLLEQKIDLALRVRAGRLEPWNQFSGCLVMGSARSRPYFRRVADIIKAGLQRSWWGMDQYALFSAAIGIGPRLTLVGPNLASVTDETPGLFWFTAGGNKVTLTTAPTPYANLYRHYAAA